MSTLMLIRHGEEELSAGVAGVEAGGREDLGICWWRVDPGRYRGRIWKEWDGKVVALGFS